MPFSPGRRFSEVIRFCRAPTQAFECERCAQAHSGRWRLLGEKVCKCCIWHLFRPDYNAFALTLPLYVIVGMQEVDLNPDPLVTGPPTAAAGRKHLSRLSRHRKQLEQQQRPQRRHRLRRALPRRPSRRRSSRASPRLPRRRPRQQPPPSRRRRPSSPGAFACLSAMRTPTPPAAPLS